jgi:hypothetical protein
MVICIIKYLSNHWHGNHRLAKAFWINSLLIFVIFDLLFIQTSTLNNPDTIIGYARIYLLIMTAFFLVIFPWQIVGLTRTLSRYIKSKKHLFASFVVSVFLLLEIALLYTIIVNSPQKLIESFQISFSSYETGGYELSVQDNTLLLDGKLSYGISKDFEQVLDANPQVKTIAFFSQGGNNHEAKKISSIIKKRELDTYVPEYCVSACTTAFIGGQKRLMSSKALLGFHRGRPTHNKKKFTEEEEKDNLYETIKFYKENGIDKDFVKRFHRTPVEEMWYPRDEELLKQGIVTEILND